MKPCDGFVLPGSWEITLNPQLFKNSFDRIHRPGGSSPQPIMQMAINAKHPRTLGKQQKAFRSRFEEMKSGIPRSTRRIRIGGPRITVAAFSPPADLYSRRTVIH